MRGLDCGGSVDGYKLGSCANRALLQRERVGYKYHQSLSTYSLSAPIGYGLNQKRNSVHVKKLSVSRIMRFVSRDFTHELEFGITGTYIPPCFSTKSLAYLKFVSMAKLHNH